MKNFIETSIRKIKEAINNDKLVIFVGAGVSANSNLPSWSSLVAKFARELGISYKSESIDENLKIPQYYFIERGKKEYYDLIDKTINNFIVRPNDINRVIFDLKPSTIITTNFDELLEMTVKEKGLFYTTIKQDRDLPYCLNDKLIIKMHGDGKLKNIVLKEEDYLNYSKNFPLIENYIKGLFSTKTILFVGYSAGDPDFKLLFNLVKGQLGGDFQPAYLLETGKENNRIDFNYYKNMGINILYYSDIKGEIEKTIELSNTDISHYIGQNLYRFLLYMRDYKKKYEDKFEEIYNKLKKFEEMKSIDPRDISNTLKAYGYDMYGLQEMNIQENEFMLEVYEIMSSAERVEERKEIINNEYVKKIINILYRASIFKIMLVDKTRVLDLQDYFEFDKEQKQSQILVLEKKLIVENIKLLEEYVEDNSQLELVYGNEDMILKKAFALYKLEKYIDVYYLLKRLSAHSFANRKYYYYFISQFNLKNILVLIKYSSKSKYLKNLKEIVADLSSINIKNKYMELPQNIKAECSFILDIENFNVFYRETINMSKCVKVLRKEKKIVERGGVSSQLELLKALNKCYVIDNYINRNCLMVEHFTEIKNFYEVFIEGVLINHSVKCSTKGNKRGFIGNKVNELDIEVLKKIIMRIDSNNLINVLKENKIEEIKVSEESKKWLIDNLKSLSIVKKGEDTIKWTGKLDIIDTILILLKYINLDKKDFNEIVISINALVKKNIMNIKSFKYLLEFIKEINSKKSESIEIFSLKEFLMLYIKMLAEGRLSIAVHEVILDDIYDIIKIIREVDRDGRVNLEGELGKIIENMNWDERLILNLLIPIYGISDAQTRCLVKNKMNMYLNALEQSDKYNFMYLKSSLILEEIIAMDESEVIKFLNEYFKYVRELLIRKHEDELKIDDIDIENIAEKIECLKLDIENDPYKLMVIAYQIIDKKELDYNYFREGLKEIIVEFPQLELLLDSDNFNKAKFESEWVNLISTEKLMELLKNKNLRKVILDALLENLDSNQRIREIIKEVLKEAM